MQYDDGLFRGVMSNPMQYAQLNPKSIAHIRYTMRNIHKYILDNVGVTNQVVKSNYKHLQLSDKTIDFLRTMQINTKVHSPMIDENIRRFIVANHSMTTTEIITKARGKYNVQLKPGVVRKIKAEGGTPKHRQLQALREYCKSLPTTDVRLLKDMDEGMIQAALDALPINEAILRKDIYMRQILRLHSKNFIVGDRVQYKNQVHVVEDVVNGYVILANQTIKVDMNDVVPYEKSGRSNQLGQVHMQILSLMHHADASLRGEEVVACLSSPNESTSHRKLIDLCVRGGFMARPKNAFALQQFEDVDFDAAQLYATIDGTSHTPLGFPHTFSSSAQGLELHLESTTNPVPDPKKHCIVLDPEELSFLTNATHRVKNKLSLMTVSRARKALRLTYTKMQHVPTERNTPKLNMIHQMFVRHFVRAFREGVTHEDHMGWLRGLSPSNIRDEMLTEPKELKSLLRAISDVFHMFLPPSEDIQNLTIEMQKQLPIIPSPPDNPVQITQDEPPKLYKHLIFMDAVSVYLEAGAHMGWSEAGSAATESVKTQRGAGTKVLAAMRWPETSKLSKSSGRRNDACDLFMTQAKCSDASSHTNWDNIHKSFCLDVYVPRDKDVPLYNFECYLSRLELSEQYLNSVKKPKRLTTESSKLAHCERRIKQLLGNKANTVAHKGELKRCQAYFLDHKLRKMIEGDASQSTPDTRQKELETMDPEVLEASHLFDFEDGQAIAKLNQSNFASSAMNELVTLTSKKKVAGVAIENSIVAIVDHIDLFKNSEAHLDILRNLDIETTKEWYDPESLFRISKSMLQCDFCRKTLGIEFNKMYVFPKNSNARDEDGRPSLLNLQFFKNKNGVFDTSSGHVINLDRTFALTFIKDNTNTGYAVRTRGSKNGNYNTGSWESLYTWDQFMDEFEARVWDEDPRVISSDNLSKLRAHAQLHYFADTQPRVFKAKYLGVSRCLWVEEQVVDKTPPYDMYMQECLSDVQLHHPTIGKVVMYFRHAGLLPIPDLSTPDNTSAIKTSKMKYIRVQVGDHISNTLTKQNVTDEELRQLKQNKKAWIFYWQECMGLRTVPAVRSRDTEYIERVLSTDPIQRRFGMVDIDFFVSRSSMSKVENITKIVYCRYIVGQLIWRFDLNGKFLLHDGASYFMPHSPELYSLMRDYCGCRLVVLPAYSPEFNPIELVFGFTKSFVRESDFIRDHMYLRREVLRSFNSISSKTVKNFYYHDMYSPHKVTQGENVNTNIVSKYTGITRKSRVREFVNPFAVVLAKPSSIQHNRDIHVGNFIVLKSWKSEHFTTHMWAIGLDASDFSIFRSPLMTEKTLQRLVAQMRNFPTCWKDQTTPSDDVKYVYFIKKRRLQ